jgi:gas vesicle protein
MMPTGSDTRFQAQADIRHLKNTIAALRDELEAMRASKDEAVQAAVAAGRDEARQLQMTIATLRDELEQKVFQRADESEHGKQALNDEVRQLRETVAVMRRELENRSEVKDRTEPPSPRLRRARESDVRGEKGKHGG